jgi:putative spermidine/putrescine transport system substrate-binding protein
MLHKFLKVCLAMIVIASFVGACTPAAAPTAAPVAQATVAPAAPSGPACDFDAQTCAFLAGKNFAGQTLVVGVWGGDIETLLRTIVIPPLEARGASVSLLLGGTGDRFAQIYAEKGNPTMDVAYLNIAESQQAIKDGVVEAPSADVPAYNDLYPIAKTGCYGMSMMGLGIAYNTDAFKTPPQWADLWQPQYKGKIAFPTYPGSEGDGFLAIAARLMGKDEHSPDVAFTKLTDLKPVPLSYTDLDTVFMEMDKGDVVAAPMISGYAQTYEKKGLKVGFSWPTNPGPVMTQDNLCIVKGIKNRDLALAWAQLALSPKTQEAYANKIFFGPTNSKVQLTKDIADQVVYGTDKVNSLVALDWTYVGKMESSWTDQWNKDLLGK